MVARSCSLTPRLFVAQEQKPQSFQGQGTLRYLAFRTARRYRGGPVRNRKQTHPRMSVADWNETIEINETDGTRSFRGLLKGSGTRHSEEFVMSLRDNPEARNDPLRAPSVAMCRHAPI